MSNLNRKISALHKSIRGSDAQAAVYWLMRMVEVRQAALLTAFPFASLSFASQ
jgi:replication-associated recombination protein RarA